MDVLEAIASKRAVRHFTDQPITDEDLRAILDAGRRAQSSRILQPWTFIAIRDRQTLRRLSECGAYAGHLAGAAAGWPCSPQVRPASTLARLRPTCSWRPGSWGSAPASRPSMSPSVPGRSSASLRRTPSTSRCP